MSSKYLCGYIVHDKNHIIDELEQNKKLSFEFNPKSCMKLDNNIFACPMRVLKNHLETVYELDDFQKIIFRTQR